MADDSIDVEHQRDLKGRGYEPWLRRVLLGVMLALIILALLNAFGQRTHASQAAGPGAVLGVESPEKVRAGLMYQARFTITARRDVKQPELVLGPGWLDGLTVNAIEPQASEESNRNGHLALVYDELKAGDTLRVWVAYQVNPTAHGRRIQLTELDDGDKPLLVHPRPLTIFS
jgi:hypothetical protein